jgi:hypothetical protein
LGEMKIEVRDEHVSLILRAHRKPFHHGGTEKPFRYVIPNRPVCDGEESLRTATQHRSREAPGWHASSVTKVARRSCSSSNQFEASKPIGIPHRRTPAVRNDKTIRLRALRASVVK